MAEWVVVVVDLLENQTARLRVESVKCQRILCLSPYLTLWSPGYGSRVDAAAPPLDETLRRPPE